jgi:hypothetical protein
MEQTAIRGAESWQFFAFVFTAVVLLVFNLINEVPRLRGLRLILKLATFGLIGYLVLLNPWVQKQLVTLLEVLKGLQTQ